MGPGDDALRVPGGTELSRRLARNVSSVLAEESHVGLKARAICADSSSVMKTIPFTAADVQNDTPATIADLVVDPGRCEGAVLFHQNRRVMMFPAGHPPILARSRAKERATAELYLPLGSAN